MADNRQTVFQRVGSLLFGNSVPDSVVRTPATIGPSNSNRVLYTTKDKEDYEKKLLQYKQQKTLSYQWVKANADNSVENLVNYSAIQLMFRDVDLMDATPEIGSALDLYAEEACLAGDTKIKLLNGETFTIEELYNLGYKNFWVYSVNADGICMPSHVDCVINKGKKPLYAIELDDGTIIKATSDHKWFLTDCTWKETSKLSFGDSLMSIYESQNYLGYEQIKSSVETKKRLTHQIVAENVLHDDKEKKESCYNHRVIKITKLDECETVYDLKNSTVNNCFAVKCNNGHVISHNCNLTSEGKLLNVSSKSKRIKAILEDLFYKKLNIHIMLPMITRAMCKYGNQYMLLNIVKGEGVKNWKQLPVYEMDRIENGYSTAYNIAPGNINDLKPDETRFVWVGHDMGTPYFNEWQVAHFRLLKDSTFLPYGVSLLHKARRAWRMWSMMEDAMLIYRLDKSVERRVFKIYVGGIDNQDVPAYIQEIANGFKRTPIIDPQTGQVDLRKNFLAVDQDAFIPIRSADEPTAIEPMPSAQNPTAMDDIQYMQNKILTALRVPKAFLNFQEPQGKGQNLSLVDIRFCRMVNTIQQFLLLELNKVAMVHLHFLGFDDELTNFTLSLNNPSAQIEALELEDLTKRIQTATAALADPGIGMPLMSLHQVLKKIMKMTDNEIKDMLNEIRLEKAMAAELEQTANVIKKTGMFDTTDRIYGDYNAMHGGDMQQQQQNNDDNDMMGGGSAGGGDMMGGGSLNMDSLGSAGDEGMPDMNGTESEMGMEEAPNADNGTPMESFNKHKPVLNELKTFTEQYFDMLQKSIDSDENTYNADEIELDRKNVFLTEHTENALSNIENILSKGIDSNIDNDEFEEVFLDDLSGTTENSVE